MMEISSLEKQEVSLDASERETLIDELMALVDFGRAINEPYVKIAGERCLLFILENKGGEK